MTHSEQEESTYEIVYYTERKERVTVTAEDRHAAKERADADRSYDGELVQTTHTECREVHDD